MGSIFSGNFGRRTERPYLDELERIHLPRIVGSEDEIAKNCAAVIYRHKERDHYITLMHSRGGCFRAVARFICPVCQRRCTVLYIAESLSCYRCAGNYRCQSESPPRRAERQAIKVLNASEFDEKRLGGKIAWRRWKTHTAVESKAVEAASLIFGRHANIIESLMRYK